MYGLKSSGAAFRAFLNERLDNMGFKSSIAYPDIWIRPAPKLDGEHYYEFILVYVEDLFVITQDTVSVIREVAEKLKLKNTPFCTIVTSVTSPRAIGGSTDKDGERKTAPVTVK